MIRTLALAALVAAGTLVGPSATPAHAADWTFTPTTTPASSRVIEVVNKLPGWQVRNGVAFVDRYTSSRVKYVAKCSGKAWQCVTIKAGNLPGKQIALGSRKSITVDTKYARKSGYRSAYVKKVIIAHEFAHSMGLGHKRGWNLMNPQITWYGMYLPLKLDKGQRKFLSQR